MKIIALILNFLFNKELKAFHGKQELKNDLISEIKNHMEMDNYIQGNYWNGKKGCAIGCLAHDVENRHEFLSKKYGIPEDIFRMVDDIFEGLSIKESKKWSLRIFDAIKVGQDLSQVWPKFGHWLLADEVHGLISLFEDSKGKSNIKIIADSVLNGTEYSDVVISASRATRAVRAVRAVQAAWATQATWAARAAWKKTRPTQETAKIQSDKLVEIVNNI